MTNTAKFWDKHAEGYAKKPVPDEAIYQRKLEMTQAHLKPDMEVLEIGCGTGTTALIHAPHVKHIHATDISEGMLSIARKKAQDQNISNVTFEQSTAEDISKPDNSVDVVLALSIIHLLEDEKETITRIHKMLKPGGLFVSSTACVADIMPIFKYIAPIGKTLGLLPHLNIFTADHLRTTIKEADFTIIEDWQATPKKSPFIIAKK